MSFPVQSGWSSGVIPPADRRTPRRMTTPGGPIPRAVGMTSPGINRQRVRDPRYINDGRIRRDHSPWYPVDNVSGVGDASVNWTACGPPRPEMHTRMVNYRVMAGTSATRFIPNPMDPTTGLHTRTAPIRSGNLPRIVGGAPQMRPPRQDRLTVARYTGQTYSQTTRMQ